MSILVKVISIVVFNFWILKPRLVDGVAVVKLSKLFPACNSLCVFFVVFMMTSDTD